MRKRCDLSLKDKQKLLKKYADLPEMSQREAAANLNISQPLLCKLLKTREKILSSVQNNSKLDRKRNRVGKDPEVEKALKNWFTVVRERDGRVGGDILRAKAEQLASVMGKENFKATNGWFSRWRKRENLVYKKPQGEQREADHVAADSWIKEVWPTIISEYAPADIYNADETALYFRALPEHTYALRNEKTKGVKISKERVTILCCASMTGEKRALFMIGKAKSPRCFKGVKTLPVKYDANANAWMTAHIFNQWLTAWDQNLESAQRKIVLLVDNCTAHKVNSTLLNIKLIFLPANTTSVIQPCDQGIINSLKAHYRRAIKQRIIGHMDENLSGTITSNELAKKTSLLDAMHLLLDAWHSVTQTTIKNCFIKGGFCPLEEDIVAEEDLPPPEGLTLDEFQEWVSVDENLEVAHRTTEEEICCE